jgi:hypothetical protein
MKARHTFTAPLWSNGYDDLDVLESFPDLDPDGEDNVTVHAIYSEWDCAVRSVEPSHETYAMDGIRINHIGSVTEWRDRAWCLGIAGREAIHAIDAQVSQSMGAYA